MEVNENILIHVVEEEESEEVVKEEISETSEYEELYEMHQCPSCDLTFPISKLLFEHMVRMHRESNQWKVSNMINILEGNETIYSSDSDCDYEIIVKVTKKNVTRQEFEENRLTMEQKVTEISSVPKVEGDPNTRVQCPKCIRTFSGQKNLRQHLKIYHIEEVGRIDYDLSKNDKFMCPQCNRELSTPRNLRKHAKLCHNLIVRFIGGVSSGLRNVDHFDVPQVVQNDTAKEFPIIRSKDNDTGRVVFRCGICTYGPYFFARAIKRHQVKEHGREPLKMDIKDQVFRCEHCPKEFWSKDNLQRHLKLHSDVKNYVCNLCGDAFKTSAVLRKHRLAHIHIRCLICDDQFTFRSDYKSHHKTEHNNQQKSFEILNAELDPPKKRMSHIPKKVEQPIKCEQCRRVFSAMCGYKVHKCIEDVRSSHKQNEVICKSCGRKYKSQKSLREHNCPNRQEKLVSEGLTCDFQGCGMIFANAKEQMYHVESVHDTDSMVIIEEEIIL